MADEEDWDHWLEVIQFDGVNLSKWEEDFIDSLVVQREEGRRLSDRQAQILERIYSDRTP
jgi:hypothetical protein